MENGRHRVYNFAVDTLDRKYLLEKLDVVFDSLKCAAKLIVAFGFVLKNVEGNCRFYYAHEKNILLEKSKLVATTEILTKIKNLLSNTDINESCTRERAKIKLKFYKLKSAKIFAAILEEIPMGCKDTVIPDPLLNNLSVKCIAFEKKNRKPYNDNLCLLRALALHLHGNERLEEEISNIIILFLQKTGEIDPANFRTVCVEDIAGADDIVQACFFLYNFDIMDGSMVGRLRGGVSGKTLTLCGYYVILATFATSPMSTLS